MVYACPLMLLTLNATSLIGLIAPKRSRKPKMALLDLPAYTRQTLGLSGLNLTTPLLSGMHPSDLDEIRERADKEACACLLLVEPDPQPLGSTDPAEAEAAFERTTRVIEAAAILGCNSAAITPLGNDTDDVLDRTAQTLKRLMVTAERRELNLLISPGKGLTADPDRVTALLKKVGGFRVGTLPDFQRAAQAEDPAAYLRRLTPYASVVSASTTSFVGPGGSELSAFLDSDFEHDQYDVMAMVESVLAVGYDGTLAIDYRGKGDAALGVQRSRVILQRALEEAAGKK
jgi:sugar phosphate isomerase/epimerase